MKTIEELAAEIVAREGGFVDDPADPGGATKHGVTIGTMRRLGIDLTGDGKVDAEDVRRLTPKRAQAIFIEHYFQRPGIAALPEPLQASVFDMYVNAGVHAVKVLQYLLQDMGQDLEADGRIGPRTIAAAQSANAEAGDLLGDAYSIARRNYYYALADQRPAASTPRAGGPTRVFHGPELEKLDVECRGFLLFLEQHGVLDADQRELVLDRAMALDQDELDLDDLKWVVLMVLFNQPGSEAAYAWMETQMFADEPEPVH